MEYELVNWLSNLIQSFLQFGSWLSTPLPYLNITPLALLGFTGLIVVIGFLLVRLVVGG